MPGKAAKGLVTSGPKLRVDMPEMNVPTKMVSMLETFWSLRNTTGTSASEPTTEQLLKDYKMHSGISLDPTASSRSRAASRLSPHRNVTPNPKQSENQEWKATLRQISPTQSRTPSQINAHHQYHTGDGESEHPGMVEPGPAKKDAMCGRAPEEMAMRAGYPNLITSKRQKNRDEMNGVKERKAATEEIRAAKEKLSATGLFEEAFELAESLLRNGEKYTNRIESSLYGGSVGLTFPCIHKDRDDIVAHVSPAKGGEGGGGDHAKFKWEEAAKARSVGVVAMDQLLTRLKKTNGERDAFETECKRLDSELKKLQQTHGTLLQKQKGFDADLLAMEMKMQQAEKNSGKKSAQRSLEIGRLQKLVADLKATIDNMREEKEKLEDRVENAEDELKKSKLNVNDLTSELAKRKKLEKDDQQRMLQLVSQNARFSTEHERIESEMEMLQIELQKALNKIEALEKQHETAIRENQEKLRVLNEKLTGQLKSSETTGTEALAQVNALTETVTKNAAELKSARERILKLEEELKHAKGQSLDFSQKYDAMMSDTHSLKMKVKWSWMITTFVIQEAFPHNTDQMTQTFPVPSRDMAVNTELHNQVSPAVQHWSQVCRAADRVQLATIDISYRKTVKQLYKFISDTYSRKVITDAVDDKFHQKRQTLPEYLATWYLEETKSKEAAFVSESHLVANIRYWLHVAKRIKMEANEKNKKAGPQLSKSKSQSAKQVKQEQEREEEKLHLLACLPRLKMFARFLALEGEDGAETQHLPLDALNVYLALLVKIQKGNLPLLSDDCERVLVSCEQVLETVDYVFHRIKTHERMAMRLNFTRDVTGGKAEVDLDLALDYFLKCYMKNVFSHVDDRLSSLFVAHDKDGDGSLDFEEYFGMMRKLRNDQKDSLTLRQLVRLYTEMSLAPMVDAPIFVRIARENNMCAFIAGPPVDEAHIAHEQFNTLGYLWKLLEPYLLAYGQKESDTADGLRVYQDCFTIKHLLKEKLHPETLTHVLKYLQRKLGLEALDVECMEVKDKRKKTRGGGGRKTGTPGPKLLSPEEMFGVQDKQNGPKLIVEKSLLQGLDVTSVTASADPPPFDTFPESVDDDDGYDSSTSVEAQHQQMQP